MTHRRPATLTQVVPGAPRPVRDPPTLLDETAGRREVDAAPATRQPIRNIPDRTTIVSGGFAGRVRAASRIAASAAATRSACSSSARRRAPARRASARSTSDASGISTPATMRSADGHNPCGREVDFRSPPSQSRPCVDQHGHTRESGCPVNTTARTRRRSSYRSHRTNSRGFHRLCGLRKARRHGEFGTSVETRERPQGGPPPSADPSSHRIDFRR